jgi:hypothetical protein
MARRNSSDDTPVDPVAVADVADVEAQIAEHEKAIADLRAQLAERAKQHYPKVVYKQADTLEDVVKGALTVLDATAEAEAAADGFTFSNPGDAVKQAATNG